MISKLPIRKATIAFTAIPIRLILVKLLIKAFNIKDLNHIYKTQHIVSANFIFCYHQCSTSAFYGASGPANECLRNRFEIINPKIFDVYKLGL